MRARDHEGRPKHERFRLIADEPVQIHYHLSDGTEQVRHVDQNGYLAQSEFDFEILLGQPMIRAERI
jgi:hypothetical protein